MLLLDFLTSLPKKEVRADRRSQNGDKRRRIGCIRAFSARPDSVGDSLRGEFVIHPAGWAVEASMDGTSTFTGFAGPGRIVD